MLVSGVQSFLFIRIYWGGGDSNIKKVWMLVKNLEIDP